MNNQAAGGAVPERLMSIDVLRGMIIVLMTFVNYAGGVKDMPLLFRHAAADADLFTLADTVVPGFLFIVGVSIPFAFNRRLERGESRWALARHIGCRTAALLFLGVWWVNKGNYSAALTGINIHLWYLLGYLGVFLAWNVYPKPASERQRRIYGALKIAGVVLLAILMALYRGTDAAGHTVWLTTSWWGILGTIGWAYCFGATAYLLCKGNPASLLAVMGLTVAIFIGSRHGSLDWLGPVESFLTVSKNFGTKATVVLAGAVAGVCISGASLWRSAAEKRGFLLLFGILLLVSDFLLRPLHTFSKLWSTESYVLANAGIWCLTLLLLYRLLDEKHRCCGLSIFVPIGQNPLLLYFLPDLLNQVLTLGGIQDWVFPFCRQGVWSGTLNILAVSAALCALTTWATRKRFILKL